MLLRSPSLGGAQIRPLLHIMKLYRFSFIINYLAFIVHIVYFLILYALEAPPTFTITPTPSPRCIYTTLYRFIGVKLCCNLTLIDAVGGGVRGVDAPYHDTINQYYLTRENTLGDQSRPD